MPFVIGMDEAGYGPNLGPLVVTATVWEVPGHPRETDFWQAFGSVVSQSPQNGRLHINDSKAVYSPTKGLAALERSVFGVLALTTAEPLTQFAELLARVAPSVTDMTTAEPWYADGLPLPLAIQPDEALAELTARWRECCDATGMRLKTIVSDLVLTARWNRLVRENGSKGLAHSRNCLRLLRQVWSPDEDCLVVADKHGGRNRYDTLLAEVLNGEMILRLEESTPLSRYRVRNSELQFRMQAESHFPVAVASLVAKYLRETAIQQFNRFWQTHVPGLRPTKGYPTDAKRFRQDVEARRAELGIADDVFWRER